MLLASQPALASRRHRHIVSLYHLPMRRYRWSKLEICLTIAPVLVMPALLACATAQTATVVGSPAAFETGPHEPLEIRRGTIVAGSGGKRAQINSPTAYCLGCHGENSEHGAHHSIGPAGSSHPVDVGYPEGRQAGFVPASELDERLLLLDGLMTCVTCHDPLRSDHALVIPVEAGRICLACHRR